MELILVFVRVISWIASFALRRRNDPNPYGFFEPGMQGMISGGTSVHPWAPARVYAPPSREPAGVKAEAAKK